MGTKTNQYKRTHYTFDKSHESKQQEMMGHCFNCNEARWSLKQCKQPKDYEWILTFFDLRKGKQTVMKKPSGIYVADIVSSAYRNDELKETVLVQILLNEQELFDAKDSLIQRDIVPRNTSHNMTEFQKWRLFKWYFLNRCSLAHY